MKNILNQLARNTGLLPENLSLTILAGNTPPVEEIVMALIVGCMDGFAVIVGDPKSTWNEKRLARMALAVAFLAAMVVVGEGKAASQCSVPVATRELRDGTQ